MRWSYVAIAVTTALLIAACSEDDSSGAGGAERAPYFCEQCTPGHGDCGGDDELCTAKVLDADAMTMGEYRCVQRCPCPTGTECLGERCLPTDKADLGEFCAL